MSCAWVVLEAGAGARAIAWTRAAVETDLRLRLGEVGISSVHDAETRTESCAWGWGWDWGWCRGEGRGYS